MNGKNANQPTEWRNPASACLRAEQYQKWAGKARVDPRDLTAIQVSWLAGKNTWLTINYTKNYFLSKYPKTSRYILLTYYSKTKSFIEEIGIY